MNDYSYHWKPCPLCGNCMYFRRVEKDGNNQILEKAHCAVDEDPEREDTGKRDKKGRDIGIWQCIGFTKKKNGKKKQRKIKPWQQRRER